MDGVDGVGVVLHVAVEHKADLDHVPNFVHSPILMMSRQEAVLEAVIVSGVDGVVHNAPPVVGQAQRSILGHVKGTVDRALGHHSRHQLMHAQQVIKINGLHGLREFAAISVGVGQQLQLAIAQGIAGLHVLVKHQKP